MATTVAPGTVEKTTVFKEFVPANSAQDERKRTKRMPIWEFLPTIPADDWKNLRYELRLYRYNPLTEKRMAVEKLYELVDPFWVQKKYGGGKYNLLVAEDTQLIYNEDFECLGEPKTPVPGANGNGDATHSLNSNNVTLEALRMMSNPEMMRGMFQMYNMAAQQSMEMIRAQMPAPVDPLQTLRNAKEILGSGEPKETLLDQIRVLKEIGVIGSPEKKGITELLELITTLKGSGLIAGNAKPDLAATFVSNLPALADRMVNGLHEFRLQAEANERLVRLQRGEMKASDPNVITIDPPSPTNGATADKPTAGAPAVTQTVDEATAQAIIIRYNLERLVAGIKDPDSTGEDMYDFLVNAWPEIIEPLAQYDKATLLMFFKSPQFQQERFGNTVLLAVADDPRLPKIIEEFLAVAKKEAGEKKQ